MNVEGSGAMDPTQTLPADVEQHVEWLAARVHEAWARERVAAGWRHGPARNDDRREHPSLVSFAELPESERQMDRTVVVTTLKGMLALGFRFERSTT